MRRSAIVAIPSVAALLIAALVMLAGATPAGAHAFLVGSNPADGSTVTTAPRMMRLDFSESVVVEATRVYLVDSAGHRIAPESIRLVGPASDDTQVPASLAIALPVLPRSAYTVSWRTLSSDDLHTTQGVFVFGVGKTVHAAPFHEPPPRFDEAALRWGVFICLALALGAALWGRLSERAASRDAGRRRDDRDVRRLGCAGAIVGLVVASVLLAQQLAASGTTLHALLASGYGVRWSVRAFGFVLLAVALTNRMWTRRRLGRVVIGAGALAACTGSALLGHSASGGVTRTAADALHLAAAATWAGVLLVACLLLVAERRAGVQRVAAALRQFRGPALVAVGVVVVTGVYLASGVVGSVDAALLTDYGRVLVLKLSAVAGIAVLGLVNTRRLHAHGRPRLSRRTLVAEATLAVLVLALAAVLTAGQPAMERTFVAAKHDRLATIQSAAVADLQEAVSIRPNRPGRNVAIVEAFDARRPAPAPITGVFVRPWSAASHSGGYVQATALGDGRWSVPLELDAPGRIQLTVRVQRVEASATHTYAWVVGGGVVATRRATVSTAPLAGTLTGSAEVLGVGLLIAGAAMAIRRRRRLTAATPEPATDPATDLAADPARQPELAGSPSSG